MANKYVDWSTVSETDKFKILDSIVENYVCPCEIEGMECPAESIWLDCADYDNHCIAKDFMYKLQLRLRNNKTF